ncbi:hypothetical protein ACIBQ2_05780 [Micromonospora sediminimaris]|uniref:DUF4367 domain-containing protein n=1 Tax=Micromonospora sediminimaris TaxID=547162 RepID=A0A9W5UQ69_9ACTN|nr:hypothetical protein [Micromonospora sediminimaris]GIJ32589.1 hypothetical protein Vse01_17370 [Micromonospora sediminimaris]SFD18282.1 hypothetical protein SAMN05216284_112131 [Micromonospora sediminimaris]
MDDLERELRDLSGWLSTPEPPDVTARVRARLTTAPRSRRVAVRRRWRYALAAALAALLVMLPSGRAALADAMAGLLRFAGVTISTSPDRTAPTGVPSPPPGQRTAALDEARRLVRFPIRTPTVLGPPEQALLADPDGTGAYRVASLLYRAGALRLDTFDGRLDPVFFKQAGGSDAEWTQVGAAEAIWLDGPHPVSYVDRDGITHQASARLAAATLIWADSGVTYRLEGDLTMAEAVMIATTLA